MKPQHMTAEDFERITAEQFNRMATAILLKYMEFSKVDSQNRLKKLEKFNDWLKQKTKENAESV